MASTALERQWPWRKMMNPCPELKQRQWDWREKDRWESQTDITCWLTGYGRWGTRKTPQGPPGTWLWMRDDSGTPWEWGQACKVKRWIWFGDLLGLKYLGIIPHIAGSETQETSLGLRWFVSINSGVLFRFVFKWVCIYSQTTGLTVA